MLGRKVKLMQITHDLRIGGLQQVVVNICRAIDRERFDISVLCLRSLGEFVPEVEETGSKVIYLPQTLNGTDYLSFLKVARILKQEKVDVIHTHNTQPFVDGTLGAVMSGVRTIVHTDHARNFPDKRRYMLAEWLVSHRAYKVVGVSEPVSQNLIKYEKISPRKVITIPNGVDASRYDIAVDRAHKKKELKITREGPVIGLGARLIKQKGISYLLKAMPELIVRFPDITLLIAGEGDYGETLKKEAEELGVGRHTLFAGSRTDMPELLKVLDLYVLPTLGEGLPMVLLEAMAAGCPIIATDVGGNYMAVRHGENGSLVEPANAPLLAAEIIRVLEDKGLRARYARKGKELFMKHFSAQIMTRRYEKLYLREDTPAA
ncbi:MAG TPA: glycosyltransferase family 4 protein [Dissulfurispiraceae bacterium]